MIKTYDNIVPFVEMQRIYNYVIQSYFRLGWEDRDDIKVPNIHSPYTELEVKDCGLYPYLEKIASKHNYENNNFISCFLGFNNFISLS